MEENEQLLPLGNNTPMDNVTYTDENIRHLDDMEHIRVRSGMYIGRLGDGSQSDDGIYVLLKETLDNSIDEFSGSVCAIMGAAFRKANLSRRSAN